MPDDIRDFLKEHLIGLKQTMNLNHFKIDLVFGNLKEVTMAIEVDYRYLDAQIDIDRKTVIDQWEAGRKRRILENLAHELSHVITQELTDPHHWKGVDYKKLSKRKKHYEERVTEHISRLAVELYLLEGNIKL